MWHLQKVEYQAYVGSLRKLHLKVVRHDLQATKDVLAMASLEVDLNKIGPGQTITVKWRGKPVFIKRRTEEDIEYARDVDVSSLRDPQTDEERTQKPEWLVLVGVCTHLGERSASSLLGSLPGGGLPRLLQRHMEASIGPSFAWLACGGLHAETRAIGSSCIAWLHPACFRCSCLQYCPGLIVTSM